MGLLFACTRGHNGTKNSLTRSLLTSAAGWFPPGTPFAVTLSKHTLADQIRTGQITPALRTLWHWSQPRFATR